MLDGRDHLPPVFVSSGAICVPLLGPDVPKEDASPVFNAIPEGFAGSPNRKVTFSL